MASRSGSRNKRTLAQIAKAGSTGDMPLDYMLRVMRDDTQDKTRRDDMAKAAAPYLHAKLSSVEMKAEIETTYVARIPEPIATTESWADKHVPEGAKH